MFIGDLFIIIEVGIGHANSIGDLLKVTSITPSSADTDSVGRVSRFSRHSSETTSGLLLCKDYTVRVGGNVNNELMYRLTPANTLIRLLYLGE